jgi:predicted N-formylglutamate amidohydrolase
MEGESEPLLLSDPDGPAVRVLNPHGRGRAVLVCEHASRMIPAALDGLGLSPEARVSHAAWDIGARDLAIELMAELDAPLVAARISRLVYDCNRPPEAPDACPAQSERFAIPGNAGLTVAARARRVAEVYQPFTAALAATLDRHPGQPALITLHSFTPVYHGRRRTVELGVLHDADDRLARAVLGLARERTPLITEMNQPYSASDGVTHTLRTHAGPRGLANVMIELRNDLIDTPEGVARIAALLAPVLRRAIAETAQAL